MTEIAQNDTFSISTKEDTKNRNKKNEEDTYQKSKIPLKEFISIYRKQLVPISIFIGFIILVFVMAFLTRGFADFMFQYESYLSPSWKHPLGTTLRGYDAFGMFFNSIKNSLIIGLIAGTICVFIALVIGIIGPFLGDPLDTIFQLFTNVFLVFPQIPFIILLSTLLEERSWGIVIIVISLFNWPWAARFIRSQVLSLKERNFVKVSEITGMRKAKIAFVEVLPNMMSYIILVFITILGIAIVTEASLSMIGLGQQEKWTLGRMLYQSLQTNDIGYNRWWLWIPPGLTIAVLLTLMFVINSRLGEVFNPRIRDK